MARSPREHALFADRVAAVRRFNRFYTRRIGILDKSLSHGKFSLSEMRVLWELANGTHETAVHLEDTLGMDATYLSRILRGFREQGYTTTRPAAHDGRIREIRLTDKGRRAFELLDLFANETTQAQLEPLGDARQERIVRAMGEIQAAVEAEPQTVVIREPAAGDYGWVIERHGSVYAREYGWGERFEGLVAGIVARFLETRDRRRERGWIAEIGGQRVGCVFVVQRSSTVAQLRLLLVDPTARSLGLGGRLVREVIAFTRTCGYRKLMLWTQSNLRSAIAIYEGSGFRQVGAQVHDEFGVKLRGLTYELTL